MIRFSLIAKFVPVVLVCLLVAAVPAPAQPTDPPAPQNNVVAAVGEDQILLEHIEKNMPRVPADAPKQAVDRVRRAVLDRLIEAALVSRALDSLPCSQEEMESAKAQVKRKLEGRVPPEAMDEVLKQNGLTDAFFRRQAVFARLQAEAAGEEKATEYARAHPAFFDGTQVSASHILIAADRFAASAEEKEQAKQKILQIAARIRQGEIRFGEAAREHSACPSAAKNGDLGRFAFSDMALPFSETAYALEQGEVSGVVETRFGYHLIKTTDRVEGDGEFNPEWIRKASQVLMQKLQARLVREALAVTPVRVLMD